MFWFPLKRLTCKGLRSVSLAIWSRGFHFYPSALRAGGVLSSRSGRAVGRSGGCQIRGTHFSVTAWRIFSIKSFVELSRPLVAALGPDFAEHIFETAGWIYAIRSSMELSRPVVVQHQGHLTLTLDFQGQILKMLYLRNGMADWHGTKGMWVDRMLDPHCDFELWPHPWTWPLIFKVKFWKCCISRMGGPIEMERKGCESIVC